MMESAINRKCLLRIAAEELLSRVSCGDLTHKLKLALTLMPGVACSALTFCITDCSLLWTGSVADMAGDNRQT